MNQTEIDALICEHGNKRDRCPSLKCNQGPDPYADRPGYDALWGWFGLSYASFIVLPRVLAHEMPDEWQGKLAELLKEYDAAFPNQPDIGTRIQITDRGNKIIKTPEWLRNYRYPDYAAIDCLRP